MPSAPSHNLTRARLLSALAEHTPHEVSRILAPHRAAVAVLLRFVDDEPEVLLMERAHREGDRWSGQVSLPGGRSEPHDRDLLATAVRETEEELGVVLPEVAQLIGRLDEVHAMAKGQFLPMAVAPFVFVARDLPIPLRLSDEAVAAFWLPLGPARGGELDGVHYYNFGPATWALPCWRHGRHIIWGLTRKMLRSLMALADASLDGD